MTSAETLNALSVGWSAFMGRALLDSSILLAVVLLAWLPFRRRMSAQFAHGLFLLVLLKLAVPFPASWPTWSVDNALKSVASGVSAWASGAADAVPAGEAVEADGPIVVTVAPEPIVAAAMPASKPRPSTIPESPTPRSQPVLSTSAKLMLAWGFVSLALFLRFLRSAWVTNRLIRESLPVEPGQDWFPVDFEALRRTAGVRSTVRWAVSARVTSPAVGGLIRPTVVMPPDFDEGLTPKQLNWVLLHELAHIRRGDLWVVLIQRLVGAFFFFNPAAHIANWVIDQLREYACDDAALAAAQASRRDCGEGFLTIVGRSVDHASCPSPALGLFESRMLIRRRLLRILDSRRTVHDRLSPLATLILVGMAVVVLPYGRPRDAIAGPSSSSRPGLAPSSVDEPRLFAAGPTFLHDDRPSTAGRPRSPVLAVAFSPDGRSLATAGEDSAIVIRDAADGSVRSRLEGHADTVTCLAYSPDGTILASAGYDGTVRLWDPATGRRMGTLEGHDRWVFTVAFAPDGKTLASAGTDKTIRLWDVAQARSKESLIGATSAIRALAFSPDGKTLASAGADRAVTLWDLATSSPSLSLAGHRGTIRAIAYTGDGKLLATAGEDAEVKLWDAKTGHPRASLTGHADMVTSLAFTPSGATLASGGLDSVLKLWDVKTARERASLTCHGDGGIGALAFAPGARRLASTGYDGTVRLWEAAAPTLSASSLLDFPGEARGLAFSGVGNMLHASGRARALASFDPLSGAIEPGLPGDGTSLAVSSDGRTLAIGGSDGKVRLVDASTRGEIASLDGHSGEVRALVIGLGGKLLVSGGADGRILVRELAAGSKPGQLSRYAGPVIDLACSPDGATLAVVAERRAGVVDLVDLRSRRLLGALTGRGGEVSSLAYSPDGSMIATVGPGENLTLFDASTRAERSSWACQDARVLAFSPDGRFLATGHRNGEVSLWNAGSGLKLASLIGHAKEVSRVTFAPDGRTVASAGSDGTVRLWNLGARKLDPRATLIGQLGCVGPVAISPDGLTLAAAEVAYDSPGHILLWDAATRQVRATLHGHDRGVASLAFSPDGSTLASSSWDRTIRLWDARTGDAKGEFASTEAVARLAFSPDGKTLASAGEDRILTLFDVEGGSELARIEGFRGPIFALAFSPDGHRIATGGGIDRKDGPFGEVKVFDAATREAIAELPGHTSSVRSLAFSPDGSTLASGGVDSTVRLWDLDASKPRLVLGGFPDCVRALGFAPDGWTLAVAARGTGVVTLLDASTGGEIARLFGHNGTVLGLAFFPDGRTLATGGLDTSIKLWDVPEARPGIARR